MHYEDGSIEGIAIASRYPIIEVKSVKLTQADDDFNQRSCLRAIISHPKKRIMFYNTHLTYGKKGQNTQASEILQFLNTDDDRQTPQILLGDMNLKRGHLSPADIFEGKLSESMPNEKLKDA